MDRPSQQHIAKRGRKACTECRQQKVRCDVSVDPFTACSRCKKMGLECMVSDPFKREHKRQRLVELEHETALLRQRLATGKSSTYPSPVKSVMENSSPSTVPHVDAPLIQDLSVVVNELDTLAKDEVKPLPRITGLKRVPTDPTVAQSLEEIHVDAATIDELWNIFFDHFACHMPVLDVNLTPNECVAQSQFLFWTVIFIAARNYPKDPSLLTDLAPKINHMALMSLKAEAKNVITVKTLLLLLSWHPLKRSMNMDITFPLSGSLLHIAMQLGLHMPVASQQSSGVKVNLSEEEIHKRAELWAYCIITYHRICNFVGQLPIALLFTAHDSAFVQVLLRRCSPRVRTQLKCQHILNSCCNALMENGLRVMSEDRERALNIMIRVFEVQLQDAELDVTSDLNAFYFNLARLNIRGFHFFKDLSTLSPTNVAQLCSSACLIIDQIDRLGRTSYSLSSAPTTFVYAVMHATAVLIRLLKNSTVRYLDAEAAKAAFFFGLDIMKKMSVCSYDVADKVYRIMSLLWTSERVFRDQNGAPVTTLRVRWRSAGSHVTDAFAYWKEEFKDFEDRKEPPKQIGEGQLAPILAGDQSDPTLFTGAGLEPSTLLDDNLFADFDWTFGENVFFNTPADFVGFGAQAGFPEALGPGFAPNGT